MNGQNIGGDNMGGRCDGSDIKGVADKAKERFKTFKAQENKKKAKKPRK